MSASACDRSVVHVRLLRLFASPTYQPPKLPQVALEIMELSQRPEVSFDEVSAVLEKDPLLAAKVLSIAQSAVYAPRSPILSLRQATIRLGLKTLRDLVLEAAVSMRVFRAPGYGEAMERLSRHSTATAYLLRALCRRTGIDAEYAFLCGLLHDVGLAACLLALSDEPRGGAVPYDTLGPALDDLHEEASGLVTRLWALPPQVQQLAASHHDLEVGGRPDQLHAALIVAEALAGEQGAGMEPPGATAGLDLNGPELLEQACGALGLDAPALAATRAEARGILGALGAAAAA
jgi:HD-like signal output (HDOD) protein